MESAMEFESMAARNAEAAEHAARAEEQKILNAVFLMRQQRTLAKKEQKRLRAMADFRMAMRSLYLNRFCLD